MKAVIDHESAGDEEEGEEDEEDKKASQKMRESIHRHANHDPP